MGQDTPGEVTSHPLGVDLGSATTVGATVQNQSPEILSIDDGDSIPSRILFTDSGFVIGESATAEGRPAMIPLPYVSEHGGPSQTLGDVPLRIFLENLLQLYRKNIVETAGSSSSEPVSDGQPQDSTAGDKPARETGGDPPSEDSAAKNEQEATVEDSELQENSEREQQDGENDVGSDNTQSDVSQPEFAPTTIAVPDGYSAEDLTEMGHAAELAGFNNVQIVRNPLAVAAAELYGGDEERSVAVVDIGSKYVSFAIVTGNSDNQYIVEARETLDHHGFDDLEESLARWILQQFERDHGIELEYDRVSLQRVREEAHSALSEVESGDEGSVVVSATLTDEVEVLDGGVISKGQLRIERELTLRDCLRALEDQLQDLQQAANELQTAIDESVDIQDVVLAGVGSTAVPAVIAVENAFDQPVKLPKRGDRFTATSLGAALISKTREEEDDPVIRETFTSDLGISALGDSGKEERIVTTPADGTGDVIRETLRPLSMDQISGGFEIYYRHRITGDIHDRSTFVCTNIPANSENSELRVDITPNGVYLDDPVTVDEVEVTVAESSDRSNQLQTEAVEPPLQSWLAYSDVAVSEIAGINDSADHTLDIPSETDKLLNGKRDDIAREFRRFRNRLQDEIETGSGISNDDLSLFVKELDKNLSKHGLELIKPEVGTQLEPGPHRAIDGRDVDEETGTILEIVRYGIAIDGTVVEPAEVVAAE